ncbi:MAG: TrkH family potassium uptake protein [Porphyromonadaceae bacterium]|nr:TrkH family potassium uptake protein [Porphyromonadaceae bacterium]
MAEINFRIVLKIIGALLWIEAVSMLIPMGIALGYGEHDALAFLLSAGITAVIGAIFFFQYTNPERKPLEKRDGFLVVTFCWFFFAVLSTLPYLLSGAVDNVTDALFESMSGITGTGASVIKDIEQLPHGVLFWRSFTQWLGGLGIILFTLAILPLINSGGSMVLFNAETSGISHDKLKPRIGQTAKRLWLTYLCVTTVLTLLLCVGPMNGFDAVCHALTTASTGGFSTKNSGLLYWDSAYTQYIVIVFMLISGINYALVYRGLRGEIKRIFKNEELKWYLIIAIVFTLLIAIGLFLSGKYETMGIEGTIRTSLFQASSILTSTGFLTADFTQWGPFFCILLCLLMVCGGCAASTSGGAKVIRIVILLKNSLNEFYRQIHPNAVVPVRMNQQAVSHEVVSKILAFLFIYALVAIVSTLALSVMGLTLGEAFGCSISCIGNAGPGLGRVVYSFALIPTAGKWILTFTMLAGRLEIFTVLILFTSYFWKK